MLLLSIEKDLLDKNIFVALNELDSELSHAYSCRQIFRTETEARVGVLNDMQFPTKASKYWQCIREQCVMLEELFSLSFEYRRNEVKIKKINKLLDDTNLDIFDKELALIDLDECKFRRKSMQTIATDRVREIHMWSKIKKELDDSSFNIYDVDSHQLVSYTVEYALKAASVDITNISIDEKRNIQGQLQAAIKRCKENNVLDDVIKHLPESLALQIKLL